MMPQDAEIALARSAAPSNVSDRATIKVFSESGFEVAIEGDNGFVCMVMRAWSAPTYTPEAFLDFVYYLPLRAPICFNPVAAETMMPYYELRHELGLQGKNPDEIADSIEAADTKGELPRIQTVSFAYMWLLYGVIGNDIMRGGLGANEFICGDGVDTVLDYNPAKGDIISNDCEIVNTAS
jgi:hypothetical protein